MLTCVEMRRLAITSVILGIVFITCKGDSDANDARAEWLHVLSRKKAAAAPDAASGAKQAYADSLAAFVQKHPKHSRAREVYQRIQLDFAQELASMGRYHDAIRFYRSVLTHDATNAVAMRGLADAMDKLALSHQKLLQLEIGMSQKDVAAILGKPIPGWSIRQDRHDSVIECWYYRTSQGGIAGVYFRDGELFAAEEHSNARLAPLAR